MGFYYYASFCSYIFICVSIIFTQVEDNGLSSCSFPFIVAEREICSEICKLEDVIEAAETADDIQIKTKLMEEKTRALHFVQEMGWLLHRSRVKVRLGAMAPVQDRFHFDRFTWLVGFSMDHDWCAVMKKLLDIIFEGAVDTREHTSIELALLDMGLLHRAVKRNCRPMVEILLKFVPVKASDGGDSKEKQFNKSPDRFLFRPDAVGPAGLTPLHVAASMTGSENVLDALTDDPGMVIPFSFACIIYIHFFFRPLQILEAGEAGIETTVKPLLFIRLIL